MKKLLLMCLCLTGALNAMEMSRLERTHLISQTPCANYRSVDIEDGRPLVDVAMQQRNVMNFQIGSALGF